MPNLTWPQLRDAGKGAGAVPHENRIRTWCVPSGRADVAGVTNGLRRTGCWGCDMEALRILEGYRLGQHAYSTSALQQFAMCPYRFALRGDPRLQAADQPAALQRMDPAIRGSIYHETQFEFLREMRDRVRPTPLGNKSFELDECLDHIAAAYAEKLAPAIPLHLEFGGRVDPRRSARLGEEDGGRGGMDAGRF